MKKIIIVMLIIFVSLGLNINKAYAQVSEPGFKVIYTTAYIYADINISADFNGDNENLDILYELQYGDIVTLKNKNIILGDDGFNYYNIIFNNIEGFVLCSQILSQNYSSPKKELDYNATLKEDSVIYDLKDEEYILTEKNLNEGQKIKILDGYDKSKEYTRIQYQDENGQIITCYVKTIDIKTSLISRSFIGATIIIVTTISLVLVVFGIKGKRKKHKI